MYYQAQNQFGLTFDQVRKLYPSKSFPASGEINMPEVSSYVPSTTPDYDPATHAVREAAPVGGVQQWEVYPLSPAEVAERTGALRSNLLGQVNRLRWERETGGITFPDGTRVGTSIEDQNRITTVIANAQLAGVQTVDFKAGSGWISLTLPQVQGIAAAIALHVQACFSAERAHHEAISKLSLLNDLKTYDVLSGWPAQQKD